MRNKSNRAEKDWPQLPYPCNYKTVLESLSKQELSSMRSVLGIKNASQLNKPALIEKLIEQIPLQMDKTVQYWDEERVFQFETVLNKQGYSTNNYMDVRQAKYYKERGILFQGTVEGRKGLVMPQELVDFSQKHKVFPPKEQIIQNTTIIKLVRGMLYYYGVMTINQMMEQLSKHISDDLQSDFVYQMLIDASQYYIDIEFEDGLFHYLDIYEPAELNKRLNSQYAELEYYPYTAEQLMAAAKPFYFERTPAYVAFERFLSDHYDMTPNDAYVTIVDFMMFARNGRPVQEALNSLQQSIEFPQQPYATELLAKFSDLINTTSQWILKGHTPNGLSGEGNFAAPARPSIYEAKKKIGRNDPCPCGSGNKFKKCCMA